MATILSPEGTKTELIGTSGKRKALTLRQMQDAVGGLIEHVYDRKGKLLMIINEEACYTSAPLNNPAREIIAKAFQTTINEIVPIRGPVLLVTDLGNDVV